MQVDIITPDAKAFSGEASGVKLPGISGSFEIRHNHAPIISALTEGEVVVRVGATVENFTIDGGIVEMVDNQVTVLAEKVSNMKKKAN
jgi:F-type H+-transporting ATPase subunit epsilon